MQGHARDLALKYIFNESKVLVERNRREMFSPLATWLPKHMYTKKKKELYTLLMRVYKPATGGHGVGGSPDL